MRMWVRESGNFPHTCALTVDRNLYTVPIPVKCYKIGEIKIQ